MRKPAARMVETSMRMPASPVSPPVRKIRVRVVRRLQPRLISEFDAAPARSVMTGWNADQARQMREMEAVQREDAPLRVTFAIFEFSSYSAESAQPVRRLFILQL